MATSASSNSDPREYIDFMLKRFKLERYFYTIATIISIALLLYCAIILINSKEYTSALALLAPGGTIAFACSRLLKMWTDCIKIVARFLDRS